MREEFSENIQNYNEAIKTSFKDMSKEGKLRAEEIKNQLVEITSKNTHTTKEAELEIFNIQKQKQEKFRKFRKFLDITRGCEKYDDSKRDLNKGKPVVSMTKEGVFTITEAGGQYKIVTMGEIMTDIEWGNEYTFDQTVNVHDVREYYLNKLKMELHGKLDSQIIESELSNTYVDTAKQDAYRKIKERNIEELSLEKRGVIAEKMVSTFLEQISMDFDDADFTITKADVYQDVNQKIDFIIERKDKLHGAKVEESDTETEVSSKTIGIQFTTAEGKIEDKENQIIKAKRNAKEVDDIVLVTIPMEEASYIYKKWAEKKDPGGPMKLWNNKTKSDVFRAVMKNVLTGEEIDKFCVTHFE